MPRSKNKTKLQDFIQSKILNNPYFPLVYDEDFLKKSQQYLAKNLENEALTSTSSQINSDVESVRSRSRNNSEMSNSNSTAIGPKTFHKIQDQLILQEKVKKNRKMLTLASICIVFFLLVTDNDYDSDGSIFDEGMYRDHQQSSMVRENFKNKNNYKHSQENLFEKDFGLDKQPMVDDENMEMIVKEQLEHDGFDFSSLTSTSSMKSILNKIKSFTTTKQDNQKIYNFPDHHPWFYIYDQPSYNWLGNCSEFKDWMLGDHLNSKHGDDLQFILRALSIQSLETRAPKPEPRNEDIFWLFSKPFWKFFQAFLEIFKNFF